MDERAGRSVLRVDGLFVLAAGLALGAAAVVAQSVLIRELSLLWFGSELCWGMTLSAWLAGVAVGATASGLLSRRVGPAVPATVLAVVLAATLPAGLWALRSARSLVAVGPGELIPTSQMLLLTAATAGATGLWVGALFPAGAALAADVFGEARRGIGVFFLTEAAGTLAGGVAFTFWWVERADPFTLNASLSAVLLLAVGGACAARGAGRRRRPLHLACGGLAAVFAGMLIGAVWRGWGRWAEQASLRVRWRDLAHAAAGPAALNHVAGAESRFQRIDLGEMAGQWTLYLNCRPTASFPVGPFLAPYAHLAASQCPTLRRVLVIGPATGELAAELRRYPGATVETVELDERVHDLLAAHVRPAPPRPTRFADGRHDLKAGEGSYDLICLDVGDPTSITAGRFYTREFFREARSRLGSQGVLAFSLAGPAGKVSPDLAAYLGSIHRAAAGVFAEQLWTWSDPTWVFAAPSAGVVTADAETLRRRYRAHEGPADFDPDYFLGWERDRLRPDRLAELKRALAAAGGRVHTDARPIAMFLHLKREEQTLRSLAAGPAGPKRASLLAWLGRVRLPHALLAAAGAGAIVCGVSAFGARRPTGAGVRRLPLLFSLVTTGLAGIGLEIVLLTAFQNLYGYVYSHVALIVAIYMAGVAAGSFTQSRRRFPSARGAWRRLLLLDGLLAAGCAAAPLLLAALGRMPAGETALAVTEGVVLAMVAAAGLAGGMAVPLAAGLYPRAAGHTGPVAGAVDAADCLGGAVGAIACGLVMLPLLGWTAACAVLALLKLTALAALLTARPGGTGPQRSV